MSKHTTKTINQVAQEILKEVKGDDVNKPTKKYIKVENGIKYMVTEYGQIMIARRVDKVVRD